MDTENPNMSSTVLKLLNDVAKSYDISMTEALEMIVETEGPKYVDELVTLKHSFFRPVSGPAINLIKGGTTNCQCLNKNGTRCKTSINLSRVKHDMGKQNVIAQVCKRHINEAEVNGVFALDGSLLK